MNYLEQFAKESTAFDLALYAGVIGICFVLFKDKLAPVTKWIGDVIAKLKPNLKAPDLDFITVVESRDEDTELFFELVKSWKKTRDLAEDYGATKAVDIADQMFPYLVPNEEEITDE